MACLLIETPTAPDLVPSVDLNTFFDVSLDLLVVRELEGTVVKASSSWLTMLGYRPDEIEGRGLMRLVHPEDRPSTLHSVTEVENRRPGDPVLGQVNRYRHKSGHYVSLEWRAQRLGDRIYGVARDVTDKVAAERALRAAKTAAEVASRAKSDFLANMSHEIRTPLNGVIGILDALKQTPLSPAQSEMVDLITASGVTLERLVSDILDVSKIEAGQLAIETCPFDLDDALGSPLEVMRLRAEDKGVAFNIERAADARGVFVGDSTRIRQVVTNLLSNAVKFTREGAVTARILLTPEQHGQTWLDLEIEDTGIGFDFDHAARLFSRFSQADTSITRRFGGTGLGLSICHSLIEMMGGTIEAVSTPGVGSRFSVRLPLTRAASLADYDAQRRSVSPLDVLSRRPLRVLLAEDHPINQRVVQLILADPSVELIIVDDGAQAVVAFENAPFDVVLMDMQMPGMDGLTATRAIRQVEAVRAANAHTPIVMLSANAMAEHRAQALDAGADIHVPKPITAASLMAGIHSVLAA